MAYRVGRKMVEVERNLNISAPTLRAWREDKFICPMGCPYHGWEKLISEGARVSDVKADLVAGGQFDPVATSSAIEAIVGERPLLAEVGPTVSVTLSERQRLAHWYYLYCHTFYQLTGVALDHLTLRDAISGVHLVEAQTRYEKGLRLNNAGDAIRCLAVCQDQIRGLEAAVNGFTPGSKELKALPPPDPFANMSPKEIREILAASKTTAITGLAEEG